MRRFASIAIGRPVLAGALAAFAFSASAAEEPPHTVVLSDGDFQIRDYPSLTIAEVTVRADRNDAAYAGFRKLAGYIFGGNAEKQKIEMTAPVIEAAAGADDKGGVARRGQFGSSCRVARRSQRCRSPTIRTIRMVETPPTRYAVLRYSGLAGDDTVREKTRALQAIIEARRLQPTGAPLLAFYDPPWTPWFMRRNEIMIPIG